MGLAPLRSFASPPGGRKPFLSSQMIQVSHQFPGTAASNAAGFTRVNTSYMPERRPNYCHSPAFRGYGTALHINTLQDAVQMQTNSVMLGVNAVTRSRVSCVGKHKTQAASDPPLNPTVHC